VRADYDVVVVGGGHNGLVCATRLARAGRRVALCERRGALGGRVAGEPFGDGLASAGLAQDTTGLRPRVVRELELVRHGLRLRQRRPDLLALGARGEGFVLPGDTAPAVEAIARFSAVDAPAYESWRAFLERVRSPLETFLDRAPVEWIDPRPADLAALGRRGLGLRRLGRARMLELLRLPPLPVADWLDEWFESDLLKAALALPAVAGGPLGPRAPWTTLNLLLLEAAAGPGVVGGGPALVAALERAARHHGVEIRTGSEVTRIRFESGRVGGVELADGAAITAGTVAAACDQKTVFLELLDPAALDLRLEERARQFRTRGTTAEVMLAVENPVRFDCAPEHRVERASIAATLDAIERAHDDSKYRRVSEHPVLELHQPGGGSNDPPFVVGVQVHFAPYALEGGWNDARREALGDHVLDRIEEHASGFARSVVSRRVRTPQDLEQELGLPGGQIQHGEHAPDQLLVRPFPGCARYATPVAGLFLCGGSSHPGGGITGAPGLLAAETILGARRTGQD
jgi:phytoene dehydrogenase-like protein